MLKNNYSHRQCIDEIEITFKIRIILWIGFPLMTCNWEPRCKNSACISIIPICSASSRPCLQYTSMDAMSTFTSCSIPVSAHTITEATSHLAINPTHEKATTKTLTNSRTLQMDYPTILCTSTRNLRRKQKIWDWPSDKRADNLLDFFCLSDEK